jgi:hypothetical protein
MTHAISSNSTPPPSRPISSDAVFADLDRWMQETARLATDSLLAGKSDREVALESALHRERAQAATDSLVTGTSDKEIELESQLAIEKADRIRKQLAQG